jgi:anti-sigma B factor antagonist
MSQPLSIRIELKTTAIVVRMEGDANASSAAALDRQVREVIVREPGLVIVDLAGVNFISSTAVGLLAHLQRGVEASGGRLYLAGPSPRVREVIERCRVGDLLPMIEGMPSNVN